MKIKIYGDLEGAYPPVEYDNIDRYSINQGCLQLFKAPFVELPEVIIGSGHWARLEKCDEQ